MSGVVGNYAYMGDKYSTVYMTSVRHCILHPATERAPQSTYKAIQAMKTSLRFAFFASIFLVPVLMHAQTGPGGCVDSPECPTAILGIVGAAGAALYAKLRSK